MYYFLYCITCILEGEDSGRIRGIWEFSNQVLDQLLAVHWENGNVIASFNSDQFCVVIAYVQLQSVDVTSENSNCNQLSSTSEKICTKLVCQKAGLKAVLLLESYRNSVLIRFAF